MTKQWRRDFNFAQGLNDTGFFEMVTVKPQETVATVWWQYQFTNFATGTTFPLGNSPGRIGLILSTPGVKPPDPFNDPFAPWIDMNFITWEWELSRATDVDWSMKSDMGPQGRHGKAMRKNMTGSNQSLFMSYHLYGNGSPAGWTTSMNLWVQADALILNVQP